MAWSQISNKECQLADRWRRSRALCEPCYPGHHKFKKSYPVSSLMKTDTDQTTQRKRSYHLLNTYCNLGIVFYKFFSTLTQLFYCLHFMDEESEVQMCGATLPKVMKLVNWWSPDFTQEFHLKFSTFWRSQVREHKNYFLNVLN